MSEIAMQTAPMKAPSMPETARVIDFQSAELDRLRSLVDQLAERLSPILRPASPEAVADKDRLEMRSPLAQALDAHAASIALANGRLVDLLDRIEV